MFVTRGEDFEDKENSPNHHNKAEAKEEGGHRRTSGGFSRLLNDVTNSIKLEHDEKLCQKIQNEMVAEHKEMIRKDVNEGHSLAIQVAVEERRRIQKELAAKKDAEEKDSYLAKKVYDQEKHAMDLCERDESLAKEVHDAEVAAELQKLFVATKKRMEELESADAKLAYQAQDELMKTESMLLAQQEKEDRLVAQRVLEEEKDLQKHIWNQQILQQEEDFKYSNKLLIATARAEHRRQKYVKMVVNRPCSAEINCSACNHAQPSASELWRDADAVVEDVMGGICISLLLPNIERVTVKLVSSRVVAVEATRLVPPEEVTEKKPPHTVFCMDFEIDWVGGAVDLNMTQEDLGYEYSSDTGMLHVYVDRVHLEAKTGTNRSHLKQHGDGSPSSSSSSPSSSPTSSSSISREILGGVIRTVKTKLGSLSRKMFSRQSSSGSNVGSPGGPTYEETKQGCEESK